MPTVQVPRSINRIVLLSLDSLPPATAIPVLAEHFQGRIVAIVLSLRFGGKYGTRWAQLKKAFARSGLRFVIYVSLQLFLFYPMCFLADGINLLLGRRKCAYPLRHLARRYNIPVISTREPNSRAIVERIRSFNPDLIVSCYFDHVIRQKLIELPRWGIINIHSGILPDIKGPVPNIWAVIEGCKHVGASVHYIDSETLDTGPILKLARMERNAAESVLSLDCRLLRLGARLAIDAITEIENGTAVAVAQDQTAGRYFSYPSRHDMRRFRQQNGRLYRICDFVRQFFAAAEMRHDANA